VAEADTLGPIDYLVVEWTGPQPDGTALPHLIDLVDPTESYSAGRFRTDVIAATESILARGKVPLLVGGTMLYYRSLVQGMDTLPAADPGIRATLDAEAAVAGWPARHLWSPTSSCRG